MEARGFGRMVVWPETAVHCQTSDGSDWQLNGASTTVKLILLVTFQAMKRSGHTWPIVSEAVQETCLQRLTGPCALQTSSALVPSSACFKANAIWSSVNLLLFTTCSRPLLGA